MPSKNPYIERQIAGFLLIILATGLLLMVLIETFLVTSSPIPLTLHSDFIQKARLDFVLPKFLAYMVMGGLGLVGTLGVVQIYGHGGARLTNEVVRLAGLAYFVTSFWLWSAVWMVQYKITLLAEGPTQPPEWLIQIYQASDALWALPSWGSLGPAIVFFAGMGILLLRGARLLPRVAGGVFIALAVSKFADLVLVGVRGGAIGNTGGMDFAFLNDIFFAIGQIIAFILAGLSVHSERGIFMREQKL